MPRSGTHAGSADSGCAVRPALAAAVAGLRPDGGADPRARHRRQHRHLQPCQRRAAAAAAVRRRARAGARPPAGAAGRLGEHPLLGQGGRRLPGATRHARRLRRVPRNVVHPAQPGRAGPRAHGGGVGQLLRRARRAAAPRPDVPRRRRRSGGRGRARPQLPVLAAALRRRPGHRRSGFPNERPAAYRGRRPAAGAAVSAGERRLHADVGLSVPRPRRGPDGGGPHRVPRHDRLRPARAGGGCRPVRSGAGHGGGPAAGRLSGDLSRRFGVHGRHPAAG